MLLADEIPTVNMCLIKYWKTKSIPRHNFATQIKTKQLVGTWLNISLPNRYVLILRMYKYHIIW